MRISKLGQKLAPKHKCLDVHHTTKRQNCFTNSSGRISVSNNLNLKYIKLLQSKFSMSNRETHKDRPKNFKQHNFCFYSPSYLRKSSLIELMYMTFQVSNSFRPVVFISTMVLWVLTSATSISLKKNGGVLSQVIKNLKSAPEGQLCSFRAIIQRVFIFGLGCIWVQFSTLSCRSFLPPPWFPSEV